jgi:hypothetical protein
MRSGSWASRGLFGSKSGSDTIATISPVLTLETRPEAGLGLVFLLGLEQFVAQRVLDAQVDRQFHRPLQTVGREAGAMQIGEAVIVEPFLHPGDALVVDVDQADQVRDFVAGG